MRWLIFVLCLGLLGATPIYVQHDTPKKVDDEFVNGFQSLQPRNMKVIVTTPSLSELQDNEMVVMSTASYVALFFRNGQEIYKINGSCVTVRR